MGGPRFDAYIICATPRSGSTHLCHLLSASGVAGKPESYFHAPSVRRWAEVQGVSEEGEGELFDRVLSATLTEGRAGSGVFGLRLMRGSYDFLMAQLAQRYPDCATDSARFAAAFGRILYIHLSRKDRIAQAVSRLRAEQTGLWHRAVDGAALERQAPLRSDGYDRDAISQHVAELDALEGAWRAWFAREGIAPLVVDYDALAADPNGTLERILEALGLETNAANHVTPQVAKLADATNAAWIARYRAETA